MDDPRPAQGKSVDAGPLSGELAEKLVSGIKDIKPEALPAELPPGEEDNSKKEIAQIQCDAAKAQAEHARREGALRLQGMADDLKARKKYADRIFYLIVGWLSSILVVVLLQGFLGKREIALRFKWLGLLWTSAIHFELSDTIVLALIGGTTASVLGLFVIVANYFFPKKS